LRKNGAERNFSQLVTCDFHHDLKSNVCTDLGNFAHVLWVRDSATAFMIIAGNRLYAVAHTLIKMLINKVKNVIMEFGGIVI
jgi:hypothetical protein